MAKSVLTPKAALVAAVSIDLDGLDCYHAIHGLMPTSEGHVIYPLGVQRFIDLLAEIEIPATLFVITRDLAHRTALDTLRRAVEAGHEIASHTRHHPYGFGQLVSDRVREEIVTAGQDLTDRLGLSPVGFRAPGYNVGETVLDCLEDQGYLYDSSVFSCPPYYLAKALIMGAMRLWGRPSGSHLTDPRALLAPLVPYRPKPGAFYRRARAGQPARRLWEIPMCVVPGLGFPLIGTSLTLMGISGFESLYPWLRRTQPVVNLEFHAIDLMDGDDPGVDPLLAAKQPDLRRRVADKRTVFREVLRLLKCYYHFGTLADLARSLGQSSRGEL